MNGVLGFWGPEVDLTCDNDNANVDTLLSFQNRLDILPAALLPWRQARSFLSAQSKAECRATHLDHLKSADTLPPWAYNLEAMPGYLDRELEALIGLRRAHGIELIQLARDLLRSRARVHNNTGRASLLTCEILYRDDAEGWTNAKDLLAQLVGTDRAKCLTSLTKRSDYLSTHPVPDDDILKSMRNGPPAPLRRPNTRARSRSRSPRRPRSPNNSRDVTNRRPLAPRGNRAASSSSTSAETAPARMPKDTRGKAKNRGPNRTRGKQPQPSSSNNDRENERTTQNRQSKTRKNLDLTPAELNLIEMFRNKDGGQ